MSTKRIQTPEVVFPLRRDRNGWRAVYKLGNERGDCSFRCKFCGVGNSPRVTSEENIALFDALHAKHLATIDGPYHAAIFNRGNVTDASSFSPQTLNHALATLEKDSRVTYVSLNSRERTATVDVLNDLAARNLPFPIHFIFGQESFAKNAPLILGKHNGGEMERFVARLKQYNADFTPVQGGRGYVFGLDVNLLFLPELHLARGEDRSGNEAIITGGIRDDLQQLLSQSDPLVPMGINIHPYYEVESLPYEKADLLMLLRILPVLQRIVEEHNQRRGTCRTHLFVGVVFVSNGGSSEKTTNTAPQVRHLQALIEGFNQAGRLPEPDATKSA